MTRKPAYRYKCDFCGKCGYSASAMKTHEKHCTANPARECRVCKMLEVEQKPIEDLAAAAFRGIKALTDEAEGCPACMLAAIRKIGPPHLPGWPDPGDDPLMDWSFKAAMKSVWDDINSANAERDGYY